MTYIYRFWKLGSEIGKHTLRKYNALVLLDLRHIRSTIAKPLSPKSISGFVKNNGTMNLRNSHRSVARNEKENLKQ